MQRSMVVVSYLEKIIQDETWAEHREMLQDGIIKEAFRLCNELLNTGGDLIDKLTANGDKITDTSDEIAIWKLVCERFQESHRIKSIEFDEMFTPLPNMDGSVLEFTQRIRHNMKQNMERETIRWDWCKWVLERFVLKRREAVAMASLPQAENSGLSNLAAKEPGLLKKIISYVEPTVEAPEVSPLP